MPEIADRLDGLDKIPENEEPALMTDGASWRSATIRTGTKTIEAEHRGFSLLWLFAFAYDDFCRTHKYAARHSVDAGWNRQAAEYAR